MPIARRTTAAALITLAATIGIVACTASGGSGKSAARYNANGSAGGSATRGDSSSMQHNAAGGSPARVPAANAAPSAADLSTVALVTTSRIVRAEITVSIAHTANVGTKADAATSIAVAAGGTVDADERTAGTDPSAQLVLRVPPATLDATLAKLDALGTEKARQLSSQDVTAKVADVTSRVASEGTAIARLRQLYGSATKVSDVIEIENELATRESDLESLQAQQRALSAQTSMATITLTLARAGTPVVHRKAQHRSGFLGGLHSGWDAFTRAASAVATAGGAALPFLVLLLILAAGARLLWPRVRPSPAPAAASTATTPAE